MFWYKDPISLDVPCVPERPDSTWWNSAVVSAARRSISDPDCVAVVITGRELKSFARFRIAELLKQAGLQFDGVYLSTSNDTPSFKLRTISTLLQHLPDVTKVVLWEDHAKNLALFTKHLQSLQYTVEPHLVKTSPSTCNLKVASTMTTAERFLDLFITEHELREILPRVDGETAHLLIQTYQKALDMLELKDNLSKALGMLQTATDSRDEEVIRNAVFNAGKYLGLRLPSNHY
jgi:hypothetical protein